MRKPNWTCGMCGHAANTGRNRKRCGKCGAMKGMGMYRADGSQIPPPPHDPPDCPVDDPSCTGGDGDCHDACERPAVRAKGGAA